MISFHVREKYLNIKLRCWKNNLEIPQEKSYQLSYFLYLFKSYGGPQKNFLIALSNYKNVHRQFGRKKNKYKNYETCKNGTSIISQIRRTIYSSTL